VKAGIVCSVAGWGSLQTSGPPSSLLMEANTTTKNQADCKKKWRHEYFPSQMICAHGSGGSCLVCVKIIHRLYGNVQTGFTGDVLICVS